MLSIGPDGTATELKKDPEFDRLTPVIPGFTKGADELYDRMADSHLGGWEGAYSTGGNLSDETFDLMYKSFVQTIARLSVPEFSSLRLRDRERAIADAKGLGHHFLRAAMGRHLERVGVLSPGVISHLGRVGLEIEQAPEIAAA